MDIARLVESLHPLERRVVPVLSQCSTLKQVMAKSGLSEAEAMRALQWLENKQVLKIESEVKETIRLDTNGTEYLNKGLPERRFLEALKDGPVSIKDLGAKASLSPDEVTVCLGLLKGKAAINLDKGSITITDHGNKILSKEWLEEIFLKKISSKDITPSDLSPEEKFAFDIFQKRKSIVKVDLEKIKHFTLTDDGKQLASADLGTQEMLDRITQGMMKQGSWKDKPFRRYDVRINVPKIYRGRRHFVNQATDYAKQVWVELGFREMHGPIVNTAFWNFDALFTAQDHPVRDLQDTFYLKTPKAGRLPDPKLVKRVSAMHEHGGDIDSTGWQYKWDPEPAKRLVLRTHTTVLSAKTIAALKKSDWPAKFFAVGRCFRNEAVDWSHLFEFNQTEGIVVDPNANFRHLLGYLKRFFSKLGFPQARFRPAYFPYTEPSVEIDVFHPVHNKWVELGGAGMFRPEVVEPLLGEEVPVLAWGPGFDRIMMEYYRITDLRDLYRNDLSQMRTMRQWMR
ncbi:phenylalanine--tRNA ligase subunit alpha [Candidatus Woesearchaeota archaeon]|nr:phenylalanine--tRNA ligase subunit alpha [Candidatus Woesearchaeota archaeon]